MKKTISALIALLIILCAHDVYSLVYKPNTAYTKLFTTSKFSTGELYDATGTPVATANKNGTDDGTFTLTTASAGTGRYKITGTVPAGYVAGDVVNVYVTATVDGVSAQAVVDTFTVDTSFVSDNYGVVTNGTYGNAAIKTAVASIPTNPLTTLGTNAPSDWINADAVKADAVTKIQAGLSTYAGGTVAGVTNPVALTADYDAAKTAASQASVDAIPILSEIEGSTVIAKEASVGAIPTNPLLTNDVRLDNLDASISSRSTYAGGAVASVTDPVTVGTNNDKSGYALTISPPTALEIDTQLSNTHGENTWESSGGGASLSEIEASTILAKEATLTLIKTQADKFLFDGSNFVKSTPQTAVTVTPSQLTAGVYKLNVTATTSPIEIRRGDTGAAATILLTAGSSWNLTGKTLYFIAKSDPGAANSTAIVNRAATVTDALNGAGNIVLTSAETATEGTYYAEFETRTGDDATTAQTVRQFILKISPDVRR